MKELFKGFYTPSDTKIKEIWSENKTLFVFDTNVLLNLYSYTETTRNDFFQIIDKISDRVWIPYHVGLEYQRNRLGIMRNEKNIFGNMNIYLENIEKNIVTNKLQELKLNQRLPELHEKTNELHKNINKLIKDFKKEVVKWDKKQPCVRSSDSIRKKIDTLFNEKVGTIPTDQKWLDRIYEEGNNRYAKKIPPGYEDEKEKKDDDDFFYSELRYVPMYGDLIIWNQIIEKAKNEDIDSLIFITDDAKEDWWYILNSNGKKEIGARAELRDEIFRNSNISSFELLRTTDFLKNGQDYLKLSVNEESIKEAKTSFENKRTKYNLQVNTTILDEIKKLTEKNKTTTSSLVSQYLQDYLYTQNNNSLLNKEKDYYNSIMNKAEEQVEEKTKEETFINKIRNIGNPISETVYKTALETIRKNEISNKKSEIEKLLEQLKK
jgi:hypothetical protein